PPREFFYFCHRPVFGVSVDVQGDRLELGAAISMLQGPDRCLGAISNSNLPQDRLHVDFDGRLRDVASASDDLVRKPFDETIEDLSFALGKLESGRHIPMLAFRDQFAQAGAAAGIQGWRDRNPRERHPASLTSVRLGLVRLARWLRMPISGRLPF